MAALTPTSLGSTSTVVPTVYTAAASDTFTYTAGTGGLVELHNTTGGSLTAVIKGSAPSATYAVSGAGTTIDLSAGYSVVVAAGAKKIVQLDTIGAYLVGTGTITISGAATISITIVTR